MSHFAKIENGLVTQVIVAEQDFIDSGALGDPTSWVQTSYNTRNGVHYDPTTGEPSGKPALRWKYAGIGDTYLAEQDIFISPKPWDSWTFNDTTKTWDPPVPKPDDGKKYYWDEVNQAWLELPV
jgi:hypothetical protein